MLHFIVRVFILSKIIQYSRYISSKNNKLKWIILPEHSFLTESSKNISIKENIKQLKKPKSLKEDINISEYELFHILTSY